MCHANRHEWPMEGAVRRIGGSSEYGVEKTKRRSQRQSWEAAMDRQKKSIMFMWREHARKEAKRRAGLEQTGKLVESL